MTDITLLDGGMGQELIRRSGKPAAPLWGLQVMLDMPGLVGEVHRDYAEAGATVATTNSYAIHRDRLKGGAYNHYAADGENIPDRESQFEAFLELSLNEAKTVQGRNRIAGSIGPLGGSYRADLQPGFDDAVPLYSEVAGLLAIQADLIIFETVPSVEAARACLAAGRTTNKPIWLAFTVDDEDGSLLRSGETVAEAAEVAKDADAALANCSAPEVMPAALDALAKAGVPTGAYGNGFTQITKAFLDGGATANVLEARRDMGPEIYADHALSWLEHGATILGGCCETGPAHIAEIAKRLKAEGHRLV